MVENASAPEASFRDAYKDRSLPHPQTHPTIDASSPDCAGNPLPPAHCHRSAASSHPYKDRIRHMPPPAGQASPDNSFLPSQSPPGIRHTTNRKPPPHPSCHTHAGSPTCHEEWSPAAPPPPTDVPPARKPPAQSPPAGNKTRQ